jgi:hypothetical protein
VTAVGLEARPCGYAEIESLREEFRGTLERAGFAVCGEIVAGAVRTP